MKKLRTVPGLFSTCVTLMFFVLVTSTALADQITLTYIDAGSNPQVLNIDINSSAEDLALAVSLLGEVGVGLVHDTNNGSGTLAQIAQAIAEHDGNIDNVSMKRRTQDFTDIAIDLSVPDLKHLTAIVADLRGKIAEIGAERVAAFYLL